MLYPHNPAAPCYWLPFLHIIIPSPLTSCTSLVFLAPSFKQLMFNVSLPEYCSFVHLVEVSTKTNILSKVYNVQDHPDVFFWGNVGGHARPLRQQRRWGYSWRSCVVAVDIERRRVPERNGKTMNSVPCNPWGKQFCSAKPMNIFKNSKFYNSNAAAYICI